MEILIQDVVTQADTLTENERSTGLCGKCLIGKISLDLSVHEIAPAIARMWVLRLHYSRSFVQNSSVHLGIFFGLHMVGVAQLGPALNPVGARRLVPGTRKMQYLELNRFCLLDEAPRNSESRALSMVVRWLKRHRPAVKWLQTFADSRTGGGCIYRAAGFEFVSRHKTRSLFLSADGCLLHRLSMSRGTGAVPVSPVDSWQNKFILFLNPAWRSKLARRKKRGRPRGHSEEA